MSKNTTNLIPPPERPLGVLQNKLGFTVQAYEYNMD